MSALVKNVRIAIFVINASNLHNICVDCNFCICCNCCNSDQVSELMYIFRRFVVECGIIFIISNKVFYFVSLECGSVCAILL